MCFDNKTRRNKMLGLLGVLLCRYAVTKLRHRRLRRFKIRPINRARRVTGGFKYYEKMKNWDEPQFFKYTRMNVNAFEKLLGYIKKKIEKSKRCDGILPEERLVITLQYLSQGTSMQVLAWNFHVGPTTVHKIIKETCEALWDVLSPIYLRTVSSQEEWMQIIKGFQDTWNFPNCVGALDGKHINIKAPARSGSLFFNYKKSFSTVILAACDRQYKFTLVDIGAYGSQSDGGIFKNSIFGQLLESGSLKMPDIIQLPDSDIEMPPFFVADEAFPLKKFIMRPYPGKNVTYTQRIFNYRLSRARQVIENAFGILVSRWRILGTTINAKVENVDSIVKALVVLHNYCQNELPNEYCPPQYMNKNAGKEGLTDEEIPLRSVGRMAGNISKRESYELRNKLADYLVSEAGKVAWQDTIINRGLLFT